MKYYILDREVTQEEYDRSKFVFNYEQQTSQDECRLVLSKAYQIEQLKANLMQTDYQAIKYAEGLISEADYAPIRAQRIAWREEINELEGNN